MRWKEIHASTLLSDAASGFFRSSASKTMSESMMSRSSTMSVAARLHAVTADSEQQKKNDDKFFCHSFPSSRARTCPPTRSDFSEELEQFLLGTLH